MIIYNQEVGKKDCDFNTTPQTTNFIVGFFGFFKHDIHERFVKFLENCDIDEIAGQSGFDDSLFELNGRYGLQVYDCCDRRTFDVSILFPHTFDSKESALNWFHEKIQHSEYMLKSEFDYIEVVDGDKIIEKISKINDYKNKRNFINEQFELEMNKAKENLLNKFGKDSDYIQLINDKFY